MMARSGNLVDFFCFPFQFVRRNYSQYSYVDDHELFLEFVREQSKLGFSNLEFPLSLFHQLHSLRPRPSIIVFSQLFTAMSKTKPNLPFATLISLFHQLELSGLDKYFVGNVWNCYCRLGRIEFTSSLLGNYLELRFSLDGEIFTSLFNGVVHTDRLPQAMSKSLCCLGNNTGTLHLLQNMVLLDVVEI